MNVLVGGCGVCAVGCGGVGLCHVGTQHEGLLLQQRHCDSGGVLRRVPSACLHAAVGTLPAVGSLLPAAPGRCVAWHAYVGGCQDSIHVWPGEALR